MRTPDKVPLPKIYTGGFFDTLEEGAKQSARVLVPHVLDLLKVQSVIDVGCGRGVWLNVFLENGIAEIRGVDGPHVLESGLLIPENCFTALDLSRPFKVEGRYDLALCLEVAEHLPAEIAPVLVRELTGMAPAVLFSAAIPGQGGRNHINEQWPDYWNDLFRSQRFVSYHPLRQILFHDKRVCWWYRQNVVLYVSSEYLDRDAQLREELKPFSNGSFEWIHVDVHTQNTSLTIGRILRVTPGAIRQSFRYRLARLLSYMGFQVGRDAWSQSGIQRVGAPPERPKQ